MTGHHPSFSRSVRQLGYGMVVDLESTDLPSPSVKRDIYVFSFQDQFTKSWVKKVLTGYIGLII